MKTQYHILKSDGFKPDITILSTDTFDMHLLQKTFDETARTLTDGESVEYMKEDSKRFHPAMLLVEKTAKGLVRITEKGRYRYQPKY